MTFEVQQTRWDRIIRRVSGSIGPGSRVSETLSELFPVMDIERVPGELLRLGGTFIAFGGTVLVGAAGESARTQLFNPVDSGHIITVTRFEVASDATNVVRYGVDSNALTTGIGTEVHRDTRTLPPILPVGQIRQVSSVALAPATGLLRTLANVSNVVDDVNGVAVLAPGTGLQVGVTTVATQIWITYFWRERPAEQSELSL